ncbi:MAG: BREX-1 system adenine-specific DNA-methyltransferase PglX, partial [Bacilli bacterium]|nr:BREX-1 system adenine-specific DNA-methyltransferase PglX [Bacilli bacterium]
MDKNAVFGYVEYAREELQKLVRQKAFEYGITEKGAEAALNGVIKGRVLSKAEVTERDDLISNIHANEDGKGFANGFDIVMEEVAYTWFNRFIALRFMEVNGYLPSHTRVFSDETGKFNPQIIKEALTVDIYNIDRIKVADMVQNNRNDELFKYLIILQCNELS